MDGPRQATWAAWASAAAQVSGSPITIRSQSRARPSAGRWCSASRRCIVPSVRAVAGERLSDKMREIGRDFREMLSSPAVLVTLVLLASPIGVGRRRISGRQSHPVACLTEHRRPDHRCARRAGQWRGMCGGRFYSGPPRPVVGVLWRRRPDGDRRLRHGGGATHARRLHCWRPGLRVLVGSRKCRLLCRRPSGNRSWCGIRQVCDPLLTRERARRLDDGVRRLGARSRGRRGHAQRRGACCRGVYRARDGGPVEDRRLRNARRICGGDGVGDPARCDDALGASAGTAGSVAGSRHDSVRRVGRRRLSVSASSSVDRVRAGRLFDNKTGQLLTNQVVLISGERITDVGPEGRVKIPAGADVIDLARRRSCPV